MTTIPNPRSSTEGVTGMTLEQLHSIWTILDQTQREYVTLYYHRARKYHKLATEALDRRQKRVAYLVDYCRANKYSEHGTREKIINDWTFNDANDDWLRWLREAQRCESAINMELKMASLLAGVCAE